MTKLAKFRDGATSEPEVDVEHKVETEGYQFRGRLLAFDQSLTSTGWSWLTVTERGISVTATGMITTEPDPNLKGYEDSLTRGTKIYTEALGVIAMVEPHLVIHESPARYQVRTTNREAPWCASMGIRCAVQVYGKCRVFMVQNNHMKSVLCGDPKATKKQVQAAVRAIIPGLPESGQRLNEHIYDSIALGIVAGRENKN